MTLSWLLKVKGGMRDGCENIDYEKKKINDFGYVTILQNGGDITECDN